MTTDKIAARGGAMFLVAMLLLISCGEPDRRTTRPGAAGESRGDEADEPLEPGGLKAPPPVTIRYGSASTELHPWTYCYMNGCADGSPPKDLHDVGSPEEVVVEYSLEGWSFDASFTPAGEECGRDQHVPLEDMGEGRFVLRPAGYAGEYDVTLVGRGDGDLFTTFRWTTPVDGPLPKPKARLAVITDNDGRIDSYGVELAVTNLARAPEEPAAVVTVTSAEGRALTFEAKRSNGHCFPEGTVYWDGPDDEGHAAAALGSAPFTYDVELTLDGDTYRALATWPDDEIKGNEPSAALHFRPDLPALQPRG